MQIIYMIAGNDWMAAGSGATIQAARSVATYGNADLVPRLPGDHEPTFCITKHAWGKGEDSYRIVTALREMLEADGVLIGPPIRRTRDGFLSWIKRRSVQPTETEMRFWAAQAAARLIK